MIILHVKFYVELDDYTCENDHFIREMLCGIRRLHIKKLSLHTFIFYVEMEDLKCELKCSFHV